MQNAKQFTLNELSLILSGRHFPSKAHPLQILVPFFNGLAHALGAARRGKLGESFYDIHNATHALTCSWLSPPSNMVNTKFF